VALCLQFPNPNEYSAFMGDFSTATTWRSSPSHDACCRASSSRKYGWGVAALITPTVLLVTGIAFFGLVLGSAQLTPALATIGLTPCWPPCTSAPCQNIFSKSARVLPLRPCKEMAYIPLDEETKVCQPGLQKITLLDCLRTRCALGEEEKGEGARCWGQCLAAVMHSLCRQADDSVQPTEGPLAILSVVLSPSRSRHPCVPDASCVRAG